MKMQHVSSAFPSIPPKQNKIIDHAYYNIKCKTLDPLTSQNPKNKKLINWSKPNYLLDSNDENLEKCDENEVNSSANTTISSGGDNGAGKTNDTNGQQNNDDGSVAGDDATDDQKDSSASARKNDDRLV